MAISAVRIDERVTPEQRANWETAAAALGIHWPEIDEDIGMAGLLRASAPEAA